MVYLIIVVSISTTFFALVVEIYCRLQLKIISKPRTIKNLIKHYLIALPVMFLVFFYYYKIRGITMTLELSESNRVLLDFLCVIIFIAPLMYVLDWRYPGLVSKIEDWRKNT